MGQGLAGKVALVTGAARVIGRVIALRLASDGAAVVVNYSGSAQQAQETVIVIEQGGGRAAAVQADVSKVGDVKRLFDACLGTFGRLDILVNNAGVMFTKPVAEVSEEEFDHIFAVNVKGAFFCCREAARRMAEGGRIVNLSSSTTALMLPGYAAYDATKGAVEQFSHVLAKELGPKGITVNMVSPGPTDTDRSSEYLFQPIAPPDSRTIGQAHRKSIGAHGATHFLAPRKPGWHLSPLGGTFRH